MTAEAKETAEALAALERFVVDNDDLLQLEARIGRFNIFDSLGIARTEIRHSNFLGWLLDPSESHGLGSLFLKALLMDILKRAGEERLPRALSPIELDGVDLDGVQIFRERHHIDLLITCRRPEFVVVVENKVDSGEHSQQLSRYRAEVAEQFSSVPRRQFVFLTREGHAPENTEEAAYWVPYSYEDVHRVFSRVSQAGSIGGDVRVFIEHYLNLIGTRFMDDKTLDVLCQRIYKNHRQAIDLIVERVGAGASPLKLAIDEMVDRYQDRLEIVNRADRTITFIPKDWISALPKIAARPSREPYDWLSFFFWCHHGNCALQLACDLVTDEELRSKCIERMMQTPALKLKARKKPLVRGWNSLDRQVIATWEDHDEPDPAELVHKAEKALKETLQRFAVVPELLRAVSTAAKPPG